MVGAISATDGTKEVTLDLFLSFSFSPSFPVLKYLFAKWFELCQVVSKAFEAQNKCKQL